MKRDELDDFLQAACLLAHDQWCNAGGRELTTEELQALNDQLEGFFADKCEN